MAKEYDNELRGVLFKNVDKREGKKDADYRGRIQINGQEYWLDAWINTARDGGKFMALTAKAKDQRQIGAARQEPRAPSAKVSKPDFDDAIPF